MFIWETVLPTSKKSCLSKIQEVKAQEDDCAWDQAFILQQISRICWVLTGNFKHCHSVALWLPRPVFALGGSYYPL